MRKTLSNVLLLGIVTILATGCGSSDSGARKFVKVGTGAQTGVYYSAGLALADLINEDTQVHGIDAAVESTAGSVFNVNAVMFGELDFGFTQADRQYQAVNGLAGWDGHAMHKLRFVCSLHPEIVTFLAADDSGINTLADAASKTISIGTPGSGTRGNASDCLGAVGLEPDVDFQAEELTVNNASMLLQDGRIDGFFFTVGHPNGSITEATNGSRRVHFVPIVETADLLRKHPYYSLATIDVALYPKANNDEPVESIGMLTTLITSADVADDVVYAAVKALFDNLEEFKARHPTFRDLTPESMLKGGFAPLHPGALKFYREEGLID